MALPLPSPILLLLAQHGLSSLTAWARAAHVPPQSVFAYRAGRTIAEPHLRALAVVVGSDPATVRTLLAPEARS